MAMPIVVTILAMLAAIAVAAFKNPAIGEVARAIADAFIHHEHYKTIRYAIKKSTKRTKDS